MYKCSTVKDDVTLECSTSPYVLYMLLYTLRARCFLYQTIDVSESAAEVRQSTAVTNDIGYE